MAASDPAQCVAECEQLLVERPESVAPASAEGNITVVEAYSDVPKGRSGVFTDHRKISIDVALIETDAFEERRWRRVAVAERVLKIEAAARLVDQVVREDVCV